MILLFLCECDVVSWIGLYVIYAWMSPSDNQYLVNCFLQGNKRVLVELACIETSSVSKIAVNLTMICRVEFEKYDKSF